MRTRIIIAVVLMLFLLGAMQVLAPKAQAYTAIILNWTQRGSGLSPARDLTPYATSNTSVSIGYACTGKSFDNVRLQEINTLTGAVLATYLFKCDSKTHVQFLAVPLLVHARWHVYERLRDTLSFVVAVHGGIV